MDVQDDGNEQPILSSMEKPVEHATGEKVEDKIENDNEPNATHIPPMSGKQKYNVGRLFMKRLIEDAIGEATDDFQKDEAHAEDITVKRSVLLSSHLDLKTRILNLSQRRDWVACETVLRLLERKTSESDVKKPLLSITDEVS